MTLVGLLDVLVVTYALNPSQMFVAQVVLTFVCNCAWALTGFGSAILYQMGWQVAFLLGTGTGNIAAGTAAISFFTTPISMFQTIYLWHRINWTLIAMILPTVCVGVALGAEVLIWFGRSRYLRGFAGAFFFSVACMKAWEISQLPPEPEAAPSVDAPAEKTPASSAASPPAAFNAGDNVPDTDVWMENYGQDSETQERVPLLGDDQVVAEIPHHEEPAQIVLDTWPRILWLQLTAIVSGFLAGLYGTGGPPFIIWVLFNDINKDEWRATRAATLALSDPFRLWYVLWYKQQYKDFGIDEYGGMLIGSFLGLAAGNFLASRTNRRFFDKILLVLLLGGSSVMVVGAFKMHSGSGAF